MRISDCHPFYPSLRYVLLFPTGQLSWYNHLPYQDEEDRPANAKEKYMSLAEFHRYRLFIRPSHMESNHLFLTGKLFQEYVCETWAVAEQNCLFYVKKNQDKLCVSIYKGLEDAVAANADAD